MKTLYLLDAYAIIFIAVLLLSSCCKIENQEQLLAQKKVSFGDFNLLEIGCTKNYTYYFSADTGSALKFTTVKQDTFNTDIFSGITYQITYKKIGRDKCNTITGYKEFDVVEILSAKRD